jgi:hypothetical protein
VTAKQTTDLQSRFHSDLWKGCYVQYRDYRTLLRSTGHRFQDGRWIGEADPFHVFRERIRPGQGSNRVANGSTYWRTGTIPPPGSPDITYNWRPSVANSFSFHPEHSEHDILFTDPVVPSFSDFVLELNAQGTSWIRRNRPGNPVASFGQFLGELRQLPQSMVFLKRRSKDFQDLGKEYLNTEFGWVPFVKDLIAIYRLQHTLRDRLEKLVKSNGINIRRRSKRVPITDPLLVDEGVILRPFGPLDNVFEGGSQLMPGFHSLGPAPYWSTFADFTGRCSYSVYEVTDEDVWNCGTFVYYVKDIGSDEWTGKAIAELFGLIPKPQLIYQLYPWTWLVDWFANVGDIVSNLTANAVDNEVLTNCFSMRTQTKRFEIELDVQWDELDFDSAFPDTIPLHFHTPSGSDTIRFVSFERSKLRQQASPFGFGLKSGDFSGRQAAILAALTTSRQRSPYWDGLFGLSKYKRR